MPLLYQKFIKRAHLKANPRVLFVYGGNVVRRGRLGQAAEMFGEPNAVDVATKWEPKSGPDSFFSDHDYDQIVQILTKDLQPAHVALFHGRIVVWPMDGIGTGDAVLQEGNYWGDTFWGVCFRTGAGQNHLGKILMELREKLKEG